MKILFFILLSSITFAQQSSNELTYLEYLGYVKKYHPLAQSANLELSQAQANLMMARGAFDPKIEVDYNTKQFKNENYYSILNSSFKIPTWYGIELKASFDNNEGIYINPENTLPNQGLTSFGIKIPVGQGLLINQRMADLRKAKIQIKLSQAERKLQATEVIYNASLAYFNWKRSYSEIQLYQTYLNNANQRFNGIVKLIENGDKPAIDSTEASITVKNRELNLEESKLKLIKAKLELSNFLWLENSIPLELQDIIIPETNLEKTIQETLKTSELFQDETSIVNHPKINALQSKIDILNVERKLKSNLLLPKIDLEYSYISEPSYINNTNFENYKAGLNFSFPLFLRKERGNLKLAQFKVQNTQLELDLEKLQLTNKINSQQAELTSLVKQKDLISKLVGNYQVMLLSEERLFSFGESSLFLINARENNLVLSQISELALQNKYFNSNAELFKVLANPD